MTNHTYANIYTAFDKVDHNILIRELGELNIKDPLLSWIESFLKKRKQAVKVENSISEPTAVLSGVPQGSVLGPILFIVIMNKINLETKRVRTGSFADDTRAWLGISNQQDSADMQEDLNRIYAWAESFNMRFNTKKFEAITYGASGRAANYLTPDGTPIPTKETVRDLGVLFQNNLKFDRHIATTTAKGHRMAGWALRTFKTRDTKTLLILLKSLIISQCEYASIIWAPQKRSQVNLLESVQKRFTSRFACFQSVDEGAPQCNTSYPTRLQILGLYSMERRRERFAILYIYKIVINLTPNPGLTISYDPRRKTTVSPKIILRPTTAAWIRNAMNQSFLCVGPKLYNSLPACLREIEDIGTPTKKHLNAFKLRLGNFLKTKEDVPGCHNNSLIQN